MNTFQLTNTFGFARPGRKHGGRNQIDLVRREVNSFSQEKSDHISARYITAATAEGEKD